jgi:hypothetical protein
MPATFSRSHARALIADRCATMPDPVPATSRTIGQILTAITATPDDARRLVCIDGGPDRYIVTFTPAALDVAVRILDNTRQAQLAEAEYTSHLDEHKTKLREGNRLWAATSLQRAAAALERSSRLPSKTTPNVIMGLSQAVYYDHRGDDAYAY